MKREADSSVCDSVNDVKALKNEKKPWKLYNLRWCYVLILENYMFKIIDDIFLTF